MTNAGQWLAGALIGILIAHAAMAQSAGDWPPMPPPRPKEMTPAHPTSDMPPLPPARPSDLEPAHAPSNRDVAAPTADESACVDLFKSGHVRAERSAKTGANNACAIADGVILRAVILNDDREVSVAGGVTVRCAFAASIALWVRDDLAPRLATDGPALRALTGVGGLECRTRNHQPNAKVSEHARGAALDVRALQTGAGVIDLTKPNADTRALREDIRKFACGRFSTVLGPGSDPFHTDHIHLDMAERRSGYRMCQWNVE